MFESLEGIDEKEILKFYDSILEEDNIMAGCTSGTCYCNTKRGYSACPYQGCGSGNDYGWYYAWTYYVYCSNGVTGSGYWNGGGCYNAVCRWSE